MPKPPSTPPKQDEPKPKAKAKAKSEAEAKPEATSKASKKNANAQTGIELDTSTEKDYWKKQNMQYIKTQLELRGKRFDVSDFTGVKTNFDNILGKKVKQKVAKITKDEMLNMLYKMLHI